jgi:hypothetical protein
VVLTEGLGRAGTRRRMAGDKWQAAETIGARGEGRRRGAPRCWAPWIASGGSCGGAAGLRRPAVHRWQAIAAAGSAHLRWSSGKFRPMSGLGSWVKGSGASR